MMTHTYTRRPIWLKLVQPFMVWMLRIDVECAEKWAKDVTGFYSRDEVKTLRSNITPIRARLIRWESS